MNSLELDLAEAIQSKNNKTNDNIEIKKQIETLKAENEKLRE